VTLAGEVALVTGAGSGIGRAIAEALAEAGAEVVCSDVVLERAEETAAAIGAQARPARLDVTDEAEVAQVVDRVDVLVNNAGIATASKPFHERTLEEWSSVLAVNLTGAFLCMRAALPAMIEHRHGAIVNIASVLGLVAPPPDLYGVADYEASKGGMIALTRAAAVEYGSRGIRTNAIAPGWIAGTRLGEADRAAGLDEEAIQADLERRIVAGRLGSPAEIAAAAVFLASPAAAYVNGVVLAVDGGWLAA
jgi:NAD(P)-dependent dehydrogenase (short-subunit alcohol dehydrogenase family)